MSCVNCGKKGHVGADCRSTKVEFKDRPCFNCGIKGHISKDCRKPKSGSPPIKAIMDGGAASAAVVEFNICEVCDGYDDDDFLVPKKTVKPTPHLIKVSDYMIAANSDRRGRTKGRKGWRDLIEEDLAESEEVVAIEVPCIP